jgi:uncharacterized membrane protein SpoIIM required for sporulation
MNLVGIIIAVACGFALAYWVYQFAKFLVRESRRRSS